MKIKVGLIGPRRRPGGYGIGQFVAREILNFDRSRLTAVMGSNPETLEKATAALNKRSDVVNKFNGAVYPVSRKDEFFNNPEIDLVVICSPPKTHAQYINQALRAGKHVLTEKPLLCIPEIPFEQRIRRARDLFNLADAKGLLLSTNCQRAAVVRVLHEEFGLSLEASSIDIELRVKSVKENLVESPQGLFDLLIAHPLSVLVKYGVTDFESLEVNGCRKEAGPDSSFVSITGTYKSGVRNFSYNLKLRQVIELPFAAMKIGVDKKGPVEITGESGDNGEIRAKYVKSGAAVKYSEDPLKISVRRSIDAVYYKDQTHLPLITNNETFLIYALQERLREKISSAL